MPRFHPAVGELPAAPEGCNRHRSGRCRPRITGIPRGEYLLCRLSRGRDPTTVPGRVCARPDCDVRRQPQADGDSEQSDGDQSHRGAGQRPPGRLGQGSEAPAERVLLPGRRAEEEDERSRRPDGQQEGGGDEAPPQRRLVVWVGWWDRYAHSVPPPLSIDETELDGAGLRRPSFYYTTFRVK